jgi:acetyltransferase-like isoleucine patch superfamily enzyme
MRVRNEKARLGVAVAAALAPRGLRRLLHTRLLGYDLHPAARVGRSVIAVGELRMAAGAVIGGLNYLAHVDRVSLAEDAMIGHLNWISGVRASADAFPGIERRSWLTLHRGAHIGFQHYVDCCDHVELEEMALLGGIRSQLLTHWAEIDTGKLNCRPVRIGARSLLHTGLIITAGSDIAPRSVVAAGAVVSGPLTEPDTFYAGVPARARRALSPDSGLFTRTNTVIR